MGEDAKIARAIKALLAAQACLVDVEWLLEKKGSHNRARIASREIHKCLGELYARAPTIDLPPILPKPKRSKGGTL